MLTSNCTEQHCFFDKQINRIFFQVLPFSYLTCRAQLSIAEATGRHQIQQFDKL